MDLADLKPAPFNPRKIDDASAAALAVSIETFGDISGIVWNKRTGLLVCGHQRIKALGDGATLHVDREGLPDAIRAANGETFRVRVVDWDDDTHKAAMIAANSELLAGDWVPADLGVIVTQLDDGEYEHLEDLRLDELAPGAESAAVAPAATDEGAPVPITCPKCQHVFTLS